MPAPRPLPFPALPPRRRAGAVATRPAGRLRRRAPLPARAISAPGSGLLHRLLPLLVLGACVLAWATLPGPRTAEQARLCLSGTLHLAGPSCGQPGAEGPPAR